MAHKFGLRRLGLVQDAGSDAPSVPACLNTLLEQSDTLVDDMLAVLQAAASEQSSRWAHASLSDEGRGAVHTLCAQAQPLRSMFRQALRQAFFHASSVPGLGQPSVRFGDFQWLDEEQMDAHIESALSQQELLAAVHDIAPSVHSYMASLMGWQSAQAGFNPVRPEAFAYALQQGLLAVLPQEAQRRAVATQASGALGASLAQLYKELVDWLRSCGVEAAPSASNASSVLEQAQSSAPPKVRRTLLTLDKLRRLLNGELDPPSADAVEFSQTVPAAYHALEDLQLLEPMMQRLVLRAHRAVSTLEQPQPSFAVTVAGGAPLGQQLGQEVVGLMLEQLAGDARLLPAFRERLRSLEPVLLALAKQDARFFSERQHPARQYLDCVTHRSLAYTREDDPDFLRFTKALDNAHRLLTTGERDAAAFARVLRRLQAAWNQEEAQQRAQTEEATRLLLHAEQRNLLAQRWAQVFGEKARSKSVPSVVVAFVRGPWAQVVAEAELRCAGGAQDFQAYADLVDDLVWSVRTRLARRNRARLVQLVPSLLVKLRQGLALIDYPPDRMGAFFDELIAHHERAFETPVRVVDAAEVAGDSCQPSVWEQDTVAQMQESGEGSPWISAAQAQESGYLDTELVQIAAREQREELPAPWSVDALEPGAWMDLVVDGQWLRAQLTWASPHRTLFMFISGAGLAHSLSRRTLERRRQQGLIRWVSDGKVLDQALDAVAQQALLNRCGDADPSATV